MAWSSLAPKVWNNSLPLLTTQHLLLGTDNLVNRRAQGQGYENVTEYLPIQHPTANTLAKMDELEPSDTTGDRKYPVPIKFPSL